jgi:hypothetical protein
MLLNIALDSVKASRLLVYDGKAEAALSILAEIRGKSNVYQSPLLVAELQLADGLLRLLDGDWYVALDRFRRSEILARVAGGVDTIGHARVLVAHCHFNLGAVRDSAAVLVEVAPLAVSGRIEFRHRFCLVLAQLCIFIGEVDIARSWFDAARGLAGSIQSRGLFSATIFNQFALQAWRSLLVRRIDDCFESHSGLDQLKYLEAATNYDGLTGVLHRPALDTLLKAQVLGVQGCHAEALAALDCIGSEGGGLGLLGLNRLKLERAWNMLQLAVGETDLESLKLMIEGCFEHLVDDDDLALAHLLMSKLLMVQGRSSASLGHAEAARHYRKELVHKELAVRAVLEAATLPSPAEVAKVSAE